MNNAITLAADGAPAHGAVARLALGGLPSAADFAEYERAVPGSGERILAMAERAMESARAIALAEDARLEAASKREHLTRRIVQGSAAVLSLAALCIGACLLFLSESWFGGLVAVGVPLVAFAGAAVTTRPRSR